MTSPTTFVARAFGAVLENARQLAPWTIRPRQLAPELQTR